MSYLLLNSSLNKYVVLRGNLLTARRTAIKLKRHRLTIARWIKDEILIPFSTEKIKVGNRVKKTTCHWFLPDYIERISRVLPKSATGKHVLDEKTIAAIKAINKEMTRG